MMILLVGSDSALLEGLAQSFAARGCPISVAPGLTEAHDVISTNPPLVAVIERAMAVAAPGKALALPLAPGGAIVLYHQSSEDATPLAPALQRALLADLALPLERHRLFALVQRVSERAQAVGRRTPEAPTPPSGESLSRGRS
jgi:DNA-binding NtrC family response regulator